jgi:hypothetical protein
MSWIVSALLKSGSQRRVSSSSRVWILWYRWGLASPSDRTGERKSSRREWLYG